MTVIDHAKFLSRLKKNGTELKVFFDVGSSIGQWSCEAQKVYSDANFHCFEPLIGKYPELDASLRYSNLHKYELHKVALSDYSGSGKIKVLDNRGVGSSILILDSDYRKDTKFVDIDVFKMDDIVRDKNLPFPDFIKLDTQASEMKVLKGGIETLKKAQYLLCETWLRRVYGPETPLFHELATFLYSLDYVLFEILSLEDGREADQTLRWFDAVFVNQSYDHNKSKNSISQKNIKLLNVTKKEENQLDSKLRESNNDNQLPLAQVTKNTKTSVSDAMSFDGMTSLEGLTLMDLFLQKSKNHHKIGLCMEFGTYKGRVAALIAKSLDDGNWLHAVEQSDYLELDRLLEISPLITWHKQRSETFVTESMPKLTATNKIIYTHHDASHFFDNVYTELLHTVHQMHLYGVMVLDDWNNVFSQVCAAYYYLRFKKDFPYELLLTGFNKAILVRESLFDYWEEYVLNDLLNDMAENGVSCKLHRSDINEHSRSFYLTYKKEGEEAYYGLNIWGDRFYKKSADYLQSIK